MFWNPAGIALKDETAQASFTHNNWIASLKQDAVAAAYNVPGIGTIGVGVMSFGITGIAADREVYPGAPAEVRSQEIDLGTSSTYDYQDIVAQVTYSTYVIDQLALGVTGKYIRETIDDQHATAFAFDIGSVYHIGIMDWNIGARISNLGSDMKFYDYGQPIPLTFSIGSSMAPFKFGDNSILFSLDIVKPQDGQQYYYTGIEFNAANTFFLRGGWKLNYSYFGLAGDGIDDGITYGGNARPGIRTSLEKGSLGAGVRLPVDEYTVYVDYAYTVFSSLNDVHRFTVRFAMK
jgi:hypothetical protein